MAGGQRDIDEKYQRYPGRISQLFSFWTMAIWMPTSPSQPGECKTRWAKALSSTPGDENLYRQTFDQALMTTVFAQWQLGGRNCGRAGADLRWFWFRIRRRACLTH